MVLYGITLVSLAEKLRDADPKRLSPFYADVVAFHELTRQSAAQLILLMDRGPGRGYLSELSKSLSIADNQEDNETAKT